MQTPGDGYTACSSRDQDKSRVNARKTCVNESRNWTRRKRWKRSRNVTAAGTSRATGPERFGPPVLLHHRKDDTYISLCHICRLDAPLIISVRTSLLEGYFYFSDSKAVQNFDRSGRSDFSSIQVYELRLIYFSSSLHSQDFFYGGRFCFEFLYN